jgi:aminoglycoside phosphotransferase family enzyme/gluconate kinase
VSIDNLADHEALVESLMDPDRWPAGGAERRRIDTHISTVVLAGDKAYKIKKPIDLGFLDFLSLQARHHCCREELRLNSRLAPQIYLDVIPIAGTIGHPVPEGSGEPIDWAVKMQRFDPDALLANPAQPLTPQMISDLAVRIAAFHAAARSTRDPAYGTPDKAYGPMQQNFVQLRQYGMGGAQLDKLEQWTGSTFQRQRSLLERRHAAGHVREGHGDLHLGNIAVIDGAPVVFDAIEFNPALYWIDTISDVAFLTMDLHHRGRADLAGIFLDRYLQDSGDYQGLGLLRFYEVYRAMVRAKVAAIRQAQPEVTQEQHAALASEIQGYLDLARQRSAAHSGGLLITHGVSGSGKSHATQQLPGLLPAVRIRSDVERKRLLDIDPRQAATAADAYSRQVTETTYARLAMLARQVIEAGHVAIADATFLRRAQRDRLRTLAEELQVPFVIIDCDVPTEVLRQRIRARRQQADNVSDADIEVMLAQQRSREPLTAAERPFRLAAPIDIEELRGRLGLSQRPGVSGAPDHPPG